MSLIKKGLGAEPQRRGSFNFVVKDQPEKAKQDQLAERLNNAPNDLISVDSLPKSHVNEFGLPPPVMRCFEITEVISYMKDLIDFAMERTLSPLVSLEKYHQAIPGMQKPGSGETEATDGKETRHEEGKSDKMMQESSITTTTTTTTTNTSGNTTTTPVESDSNIKQEKTDNGASMSIDSSHTKTQNDERTGNANGSTNDGEPSNSNNDDEEDEDKEDEEEQTSTKKRKKRAPASKTKRRKTKS